MPQIKLPSDRGGKGRVVFHAKRLYYPARNDGEYKIKVLKDVELQRRVYGSVQGIVLYLPIMFPILPLYREYNDTKFHPKIKSFSLQPALLLILLLPLFYIRAGLAVAAVSCWIVSQLAAEEEEPPQTMRSDRTPIPSFFPTFPPFFPPS